MSQPLRKVVTCVTSLNGTGLIVLDVDRKEFQKSDRDVCRILSYHLTFKSSLRFHIGAADNFVMICLFRYVSHDMTSYFVLLFQISYYMYGTRTCVGKRNVWGIVLRPTHHTLCACTQNIYSSGNIQWSYAQKSINTLRLDDVYMRRKTNTSLFQIMACCLLGTKPWSYPLLAYHQLDPWGQI